MHILELSFSDWLKFAAHKSCPCITIICFACSIFESSLESKHQYLWKICHSATLLFLNLTHYHSKNLSNSKVLCFLISALKNIITLPNSKLSHYGTTVMDDAHLLTLENKIRTRVGWASSIKARTYIGIITLSTEG